MTDFEEALHIFDAGNAERYARDLFRESFGAAFPVPRDECGLPIPTPPQSWHQYVAIYRWPDGAQETVGFCNWIRHEDVYLEGGMCVRASFYRRLNRGHFAACRRLGGIAEMIMRAAERELSDAAAWFGYCGDAKAMAVDKRVGYRSTSYPYLIVKWFQRPSSRMEEEALITKIAAIGPF